MPSFAALFVIWLDTVKEWKRNIWNGDEIDVEISVTLIHSVYAGSGAHRTSYLIGTGACSPWLKRQRCEADRSPRQEWWRYTSSPPYPFMAYKQTNSMAFSPQANYTDWATATCWRNLVPTFADRGVSRGQHCGSPTVVNIYFLDRSCYFSFK
jgi:hypothetical protein